MICVCAFQTKSKLSCISLWKLIKLLCRKTKTNKAIIIRKRKGRNIKEKGGPLERIVVNQEDKKKAVR